MPFHRDNRPTGFYRDPANAHVLGVCAGLSEKLEIDADILRAIVFFAIVFSAFIPGLAIYVIIGLLLPSRSQAMRRRRSPVVDAVGEMVDTVQETVEDLYEDHRDTRQSRRQARRDAKAAQKADKKIRKARRKGQPVPEDGDTIALRNSLRRRFADMEERTSRMEQEMTSQRFKLERELKKLEEV